MIYLSTHAAGSATEAARLRARVHRILQPFNLAAIPPNGFPERPPDINAETAASVVHSRLGSAVLRAEAAIIVLNTPSTVAGIELMMLIDRFDRYRCAVPPCPVPRHHGPRKLHSTRDLRPPPLRRNQPPHLPVHGDLRPPRPGNWPATWPPTSNPRLTHDHTPAPHSTASAASRSPRRVRARRKARKFSVAPTVPMPPQLADLLELPAPPHRQAYAPTETAVAVCGRTRTDPATP